MMAYERDVSKRSHTPSKIYFHTENQMDVR